MSGETRMVKHAVVWCLVAAVPAVGIAFAARGRSGAESAAIAIGIVLINAILAAVFSSAAGRLHSLAAGFVSLPSFAVRMGAILVALAALKNASFIDRPTFALTFGVAVTAVLVLEARGYVRTPWLAITLDRKKETL
jgi:hypothetical protein